MGSYYQAKDSQGSIYQVTGREKNLLLSIYAEIDDITMEGARDCYRTTYPVAIPKSLVLSMS